MKKADQKQVIFISFFSDGQTKSAGEHFFKKIS
jgi:hypothetical protein